MWSELYNKYHIIINFAYKTFIWTTEAKSKAAVHCVIIGFSLLDNRNKIIFYDDTKECVNQINSYLLDAPNVLVRNRSKPLNKNTLKMTKGNQPSDGGNLLLTIDEKNRVIKKYPDLKEVIKLYLTARDYLHNNNERFCLWFKDKDVTNYNNPFVKRRLELVKQFREKSSARPTREKAQTPYLFFSTPQTNENYLCVPEISSERRLYIPIGFLTGDVIASNKLLIVLGAKLYDLGILESNVHMAWVRTVAGRLKSDYQYSSSVVYNTFPWPTPTDKQKAKIEKTAQAILDARALYPDSSLADLYDPLTMPKELLKAHQDNDRAVMEAYGLSVKGTTESDAVAHLFKMYEKLTKEQ